MPRPRRTVREWYFSFRARLKYSKRLAWLRAALRLIGILLLILIAAHLAGYPVLEHLKNIETFLPNSSGAS